MSSSLNKVFLTGNLTRDPELVHTNTSSVTKFDIAVNRSYKDSSGDYKKETEYFNIVVWGKSGENCAKYLAKGRPVLIEGRLQTSKWEQDGQKRTKTFIVAEKVQFLGSGKSGKNSSGDEPDFAPEGGEFGDDDAVPF